MFQLKLSRGTWKGIVTEIRRAAKCGQVIQVRVLIDCWNNGLWWIQKLVSCYESLSSECWSNFILDFFSHNDIWGFCYETDLTNIIITFFFIFSVFFSSQGRMKIGKNLATCLTLKWTIKYALNNVKTRCTSLPLIIPSDLDFLQILNVRTS